MKLERVEVPSLQAGRGYSHAVAIDGPSRLIFLAGHTALDTSGAVMGNTIVQQFERALTNLLASLAAAGGTPSDLHHAVGRRSNVELEPKGVKAGDEIRSGADAAAGGTPSDLASMTVFVVGLGSYRAESRAIGSIWRRLAGDLYPAMAVVGVTRLWDEAALVELQAVAAIAVPEDRARGTGSDHDPDAS